MKKAKNILIIIFIVMVAALCMTACESFEPKPQSYFESMKSYPAEMQDGADARIMSANVLVSIKGWGGEPVQPRAQLFAETLKHYAPDVVGLQEMCGEWHKYLMPQIENYQIIHPKYNLIKENRSPIIYNTDTVNLVDEGFFIYTKKQNNYCRVVTWGVFELKANGKKFAVTSTHFDTTGSEGERIENRQQQVKELAEVVNDIYQKHSVPVFATGDFNASFGTPTIEGDVNMELVLSTVAVTDTKTAESLAAKRVTGYADAEEIDAFNKRAIDHILLKGTATPLAFTILADGFFDNTQPDIYDVVMSDHYPIFIDTAL